MDLYTLLFLVIAVFLIFRLRSVFGRRTGNERPPVDRTIRSEATSDSPSNKVVPLPTRAPSRSLEPPPRTEPADDSHVVHKLPNANPAVNAALSQLMRADAQFTPAGFIAGARAAYEMIVAAFASGDRQTLKPLLSKDVYDGFDAAISDREKAGHTIESSFIGLDAADITEAALRGTNAQLTVRFVAKMTQVTRDRTGAVVSGEPTKVAEITDIWTFARDVALRDPNWRLIATGPA